METKKIFEFHAYRDYLATVTQSGGKRGGIKSKLAEQMGSHPAYLTRILSGEADLSLEQAERVASHFGFDSEETRYFLFLVEEERAGTPALKRIFREEREAILRRRSVIADRILPSRKISPHDQAKFYSAWIYSAIHVLVSIDALRDANALAAYLDLPLSQVREAISFLEGIGLISSKGGKWVVGENHVHLDRNATFSRQHHVNWRLRSMQNLDWEKESDLRYSSVVSLSKADSLRLKEKMTSHLKECLEVIRSSPEEKCYVYILDFFELGKGS